jgi:putative endonuclease
MERGGFVYLLTNERRTVLYVGVTSELVVRMYEHQNKVYPNSFTSKYNLNVLVYFECFTSIEEAINREKQIKSISRKKKEELINSINPEWKDLYPIILNW